MMHVIHKMLKLEFCLFGTDDVVKAQLRSLEIKYLGIFHFSAQFRIIQPFVVQTQVE